MTWAKIDDAAPDHPKLVGLDDEAFALWVRGLCYSSRLGTDGLIPTGALGRLTGSRKPPLVAAKLVAAGLWEERPTGYFIHDFLEYNPSASEVASRRAVRASAGRQGGKQSGESRRSKVEANASGVASPLLRQPRSKTEANANPDPDPDPGERSDPPGVPQGAGPSESVQPEAIAQGTTPSSSGIASAAPRPSLRAVRQNAELSAGDVASKSGSAERRYLEAFVAGIRAGAPGATYAPPVRLGLPFSRALDAHAGGRKGADLDAWIRATAATWRRTEEPRFASGWEPPAFIRWLNKTAGDSSRDPARDERPYSVRVEEHQRAQERQHGINFAAIGRGGS